MADGRLRKARERVEELTAQASQSAMSILNLRQMYEGAIQEKTILQSQLANLQGMLTALVSQGRGKSVTIKEKSLANVSRYAGIDTKAADGNLVLTALTVEAVQAMQEEIDAAVEDEGV